MSKAVETKGKVIEWDKPRGATALTKDSLRKYLGEFAGTIDAAMGESARRVMTATDIIDSTVAAAVATPKILTCVPVSILYATVVAARTGLRLGEPYNEAYIDTHENKGLKALWASFKPKALGMKNLCFRTGKVAMVEWRAVRACDEFTYRLGDDSYISHTPARLVPPHDGVPQAEKKAWAEKTRLTEAYAIVHFLNGHRQFIVLDRDQVWQHRRRSKRQSEASSPWNTDEGSMWEKSAFIDLFKRLETNEEMAAAVAALRDDDTETASLAAALLPDVAMPLPASNFTPEPDPDGTEGVKARVAERAASKKSQKTGGETTAEPLTTSAEATAMTEAPEPEGADPADGEPVELPAHTVAILERLESRAIGDEETVELLAWLGVESIVDVPAAGLNRALAVTDLKWLVRETGSNVATACEYFGAAGVAELTDAQVTACVRKLERGRAA